MMTPVRHKWASWLLVAASLLLHGVCSSKTAFTEPSGKLCDWLLKDATTMNQDHSDSISLKFMSTSSVSVVEPTNAAAVFLAIAEACICLDTIMCWLQMHITRATDDKSRYTNDFWGWNLSKSQCLR